MATGKARTIEEKERDRDKRYQQKYRVTRAVYDQIGEKQGWRCGSCGRPASDFTVPLQIDHEHFKVTLARSPETGWLAFTTLRERKLCFWGKTQKQAKALLMDAALPLSVRGLLCPGRYTGCNRLMGRVDKPALLRQFLNYLENPPAYAVISLTKS